jgi:hypothetical protein
LVDSDCQSTVRELGIINGTAAAAEALRCGRQSRQLSARKTLANFAAGQLQQRSLVEVGV